MRKTMTTEKVLLFIMKDDFEDDDDFEDEDDEEFEDEEEEEEEKPKIKKGRH